MKYLNKQKDEIPAGFIKKNTVSKLLSYDDFVFDMMERGEEEEDNKAIKTKININNK